MRRHNVVEGDLIRLAPTSPCRYQVLAVDSNGDLHIVLVGPRMIIIGEPFKLHCDVEYIKE